MKREQNRKVPALFLATGLALVAAPASAALLYDEAVDGDLATFDAQTLVLQVGENTVAGSGAFFFDTVDFDGFIYSLDPGLKLLGITYEVVSRQLLGDTGSMSAGFQMDIGGHFGSNLASGSVNLLLDGAQALFGAALPVSGGVYSFSPSGLGRSGSGGSWDYVITLQTVPEPVTLTLFGLGLAGLGAVVRRRRR